MREIVVQAGPFSAVNAAGIAASQTPTAGVAFTLTANPAIVDATAGARRVVITAGSEAAPRLVTLVGVDRYGVTRTEVITIPATTAGTYGSALDYASVTSLTSSTSFTAAATVGTIATGSAGAPFVASSPWVRFDSYGFAPVALQVNVTLAGGTITYTVETSMDDPNLVPPQVAVPPQSMTWLPDPNLTGKIISAQDAMVVRSTWGRVSVTAYTGNAFVTGTFSQAGGHLG